MLHLECEDPLRHHDGNGILHWTYQISPMRDIDGANGFEPANSSDSGAITFPSFQIPTNAISSNVPDYWVTAETLDPRLNQRGTRPPESQTRAMTGTSYPHRRR